MKIKSGFDPKKLKSRESETAIKTRHGFELNVRNHLRQ